MFTYDSKILIPKKIHEDYPCVACDQYSSQKEYWENVEKQTKGKLSTYQMIFPEAFLGNDEELRIANINKAMDDNLENKAFEKFSGAVFVHRILPSGKSRLGIVLSIDLEDYSFSSSDNSLIKATEGTVLERIPPRVKIRKDAPLELPHVMLLYDDKEKELTTKLFAEKENLKKLYDLNLMGGGGEVKGYLIEDTFFVHTFFENLFEKAKKELGEKACLFAVGDGNHSLATAKTCYETLKKISPENAKNHPARYAMVELVNIHDDGLSFEPIHRLVIGADISELLSEIETEGESTVEVFTKDATYKVMSPKEVGKSYKFIQDKLDTLKKDEIDYIHGENDLRQLVAKNKNAIGIIMNKLNKSELFEEISNNGCYPRKTFSMGEAYEKRYYLEARKIK